MRPVHAALIAGGVLVLAVLVAALAGSRRSTPEAPSALPTDLAAFSLEARPQPNRVLFDYAGAVRSYEEGTQRYLAHIAERFGIEALIVSLPALPDGFDLERLAVELVDRWRIGGEHGGRGLLLLLVDDDRAVKLEVTYALEDVFTDAFSRQISDLQLAPNDRAGEVGTGLLAVMEMIEERAQIERLGRHTPDEIGELDARLLSGGAGVTHRLDRDARGERGMAATDTHPGAASPEEAWQIMLSQWAGEGRDVEVDVYTEMTRLAMGDPNDPDPRTRRSLPHWRNADYEIRRDGDHAVIWFGAIDGWENAPFLFCDTGDGWKFDIVHQRRLIAMAEAPRWQVEQGPYPYIRVMREARQSTGKNLPLANDDLYRCREDRAIARRIETLRSRLARDEDDLEATLSLLRLYVITGQRPKLVAPLLERAKAEAADRPEPWRYSAIYNVNSFFQYRTALGDIERYIALRPDDAFGHNVKGFLLYRLASYEDAIAALERAAALAPDDDYASSLLARCHALLARVARS